MYVCDVVLVGKLENIILIKSCQTGGNAKVMDWNGGRVALGDSEPCQMLPNVVREFKMSLKLFQRVRLIFFEISILF